jgi:hypothetical protein
LVQLRRVLKPGEWLLGALLGGGTFAELRTVLLESEMIEEGGASPRVAPTADLTDVAGLLLRTGFGFVIPVADAEKITVAYPDALALMHDLRGMGETNALTARPRTLVAARPSPVRPPFMPNGSVSRRAASRRLSRSYSCQAGRRRANREETGPLLVRVQIFGVYRLDNRID